MNQMQFQCKPPADERTFIGEFCPARPGYFVTINLWLSAWFGTSKN